MAQILARERRLLTVERHVETYYHGGVTLEERYNGRGTPIPLTPHFHEDYQMVLAESRVVEYRCRGEVVRSPLGSLHVLLPGEVHSARVIQDIDPCRPLRNLNVPAPVLARVLGREDGTCSAPVMFGEPVIMHAGSFSLLQRLCGALSQPHRSVLEQDETLEWTLFELVQRHGFFRRDDDEPKPDRVKLAQARDFLHSEYAASLSLQDLARVSGLSTFHFLRHFRQVYGLPPHGYQRQLRVEAAKRLLLQGIPPSQAALDTGFFDQAHLTRVFRGVVGVTPGRFRLSRSNSVQDETGAGS